MPRGRHAPPSKAAALGALIAVILAAAQGKPKETGPAEVKR